MNSKLIATRKYLKLTSKRDILDIIDTIFNKYDLEYLLNRTPNFLAGKHIKNIDFSKIILTKVNFSNTVFENVNFSDTTLQYCNFENTKINDSNFDSVKIYKSSFKHSKIGNSDFYNSSIKTSNFNESFIYNTNFSHSYFLRFSFYKGTIYKSDISVSKIYYSNFAEAKIYMANLYGAEVPSVDFSYATFYKSGLEQSSLGGYKLKNTYFYMNDFTPHKSFRIKPSSESYYYLLKDVIFKLLETETKLTIDKTYALADKLFEDIGLTETLYNKAGNLYSLPVDSFLRTIFANTELSFIEKFSLAYRILMDIIFTNTDDISLNKTNAIAIVSSMYGYALNSDDYETLKLFVIKEIASSVPQFDQQNLNLLIDSLLSGWK
jgi:uncharacterized protein YjbI with pentapeptide repeats